MDDLTNDELVKKIVQVKGGLKGEEEVLYTLSNVLEKRMGIDDPSSCVLTATDLLVRGLFNIIIRRDICTDTIVDAAMKLKEQQKANLKQCEEINNLSRDIRTLERKLIQQACER